MNLFNKINDFQDLPFILPQQEDYSYSFNETEKSFTISIPNGKLIFVPTFFDNKTSEEYMNYFLENDSKLNWKTANWREFEKENLKQIHFENINWTHDQIKIFGKQTYIPRFSAWYGDSDASYSYSGLKLKPNFWNEELLLIKNKIEKLVNVEEENSKAIKFNSVLMNWYRDGRDSMGWHRDAEKELGQNPVIASLNFGATRRFLLRNVNDKTQKIEFSLTNGSLLIMAGQIQHFWQHAVPKETKIKESRINMTFRRVKG